ncbi:alpha/beta fold hydrolase [Mobilicoccus massiliensis]|uniref:alpha/beta fold hydrolase n=1 Tax=Mobilicoccus massiliensis TaxID=1522310 RepID=UPI001FE759EA|nr:alpha/beta hydrolase [Mobilicoccus massiliensis]
MTFTRPTSMLAGPTGGIEYLTIGQGTPSSVFAHGLGGSITTTRPFASGVPGTRTFLHFRGHGASEAPETAWTYPTLAAELRAVADHVAARQCLGVSMGAGAMCALLEQTPDRFDRLVFVIPALLDRPRTDAALQRLVDLADLVDDRDVEGIAAHFVNEQPEEVRDTDLVRGWAAEQARLLSGTPVSRALRALPRAVPLTDRASLGRVAAPALVIGQEDDAAHPAGIARELAEALPDARLEILPPGGVLWSHRRRVRELVSEFMTGGDAAAWKASASAAHGR